MENSNSGKVMPRDYELQFILYVSFISVIGIILIICFFLFDNHTPVDFLATIILVSLGGLSDYLSRKALRSKGYEDMSIDFAGAFAVIGVLISGIETGMLIAFIVSWVSCVIPRMQRFKIEKEHIFHSIIMAVNDAVEYPFHMLAIGFTIRLIFNGRTELYWVFVPILVLVFDQINMLSIALGRTLLHKKQFGELLGLFTISQYKRNMLYFLYQLFTPVLAFYLYIQIGYPGIIILTIVLIPGLHAGNLAFRLHESYHKMQIDMLTGVKNSLGFKNALNKQNESTNSFAIMMIDLDKFKAINDRYGHDAGDRVLVRFCRKMEDVLSDYRKQCELYRLHGDEFVIFVNDASFVGIISDKIQANRSCFIHEEAGESIPIRFSVGLHIGDGNSEMSDVIELADQALYSDKKRKK